jgi:hypothetical protein
MVSFLSSAFARFSESTSVLVGASLSRSVIDCSRRRGRRQPTRFYRLFYSRLIIDSTSGSDDLEQCSKTLAHYS